MSKERTENTNYFFFIIFTMALVMVATFKFYLSERKENQALKLKLIITNNKLIKPKPWGRPLPSKPIPKTETNTKVKTNKLSDEVSSKMSSTLQNLEQKVNNEELLKNRTSQDIAGELTDKMQNVKLKNKQELEEIIELSNELLLQQPENYSAYKAKLIALLTLEGKFKMAPNEEELNNVLEQMARFDLSSDKALQKEAMIFSQANSEMSALLQKLDETSNKLTALESQMTELGVETPEYQVLDNQYALLVLEEDETIEKIQTLDGQIQSGDIPTDQLVDEDIVQIPFLRAMAKGDYEMVAENAESFVQQFPESIVGYLYLVLALEKLGRKEDALVIISRSRLSNSDQNTLLERLSSARLEDPKSYWDKLSF